MNKKALRADLLLLLTAAVWGFGFVAQRSGMEYIGPFAYNGVRFILGSVCLLPLIFFMRNQKRRAGVSSLKINNLLIPSLAAGTVLFIAVMLQQIGIIFTTAGNAGFITGLYVVFTPIFGIFLKRKTGLPTWIGSVLTLTGLYFISAAENPGEINPGDFIVFISAFFWTAHVLLIDKLINTSGSMHEENGEPKSALPEPAAKLHLDPVEFSAGQFAVCGFLSMAGAFFIEPFIVHAVESIDPALLEEGLFSWLPFPALVSALGNGDVTITFEALIPVLYGGMCSVGIAYTLQAVAQRDAPPAHATIILCFEGCFAAAGGFLLLSEKAGMWTLLGFIFMLAGMIATQWEVIAKGQGKKNDTPCN